MKFFDVEVEIAAPVGAVWEVLTDGSHYTSWESGVEKVEGAIANGKKIRVFSEVSPGRAFPVKVALDPDTHRMTWEGGMPLGLFKGVRTFTVASRGSRSHFHMREEFTGPLLGLIWRSMPDLQPSFQKFANGLKAQAEARS